MLLATMYWPPSISTVWSFQFCSITEVIEPPLVSKRRVKFFIASDQVMCLMSPASSSSGVACQATPTP